MELAKLDRGTGRVIDVKEMILLTNAMRRELDNFVRSIGLGRVTKFSENFLSDPEITIELFSMDYLATLNQEIIDKYIKDLTSLGFNLGYRKKNNKKVFFIKRDRRNRDTILEMIAGSNISNLSIKSNWARVQEISFSASEDFLVKGSFSKDKRSCWNQKYYKRFLKETGFMLQRDSHIDSNSAVLNFVPLIKISRGDNYEILKKLNEKNEYANLLKYNSENIYRIVNICQETGLGSNVYFHYEKFKNGTYITGFSLKIS